MTKTEKCAGTCKGRVWGGIRYEQKTYCTICAEQLKLYRIQPQLDPTNTLMLELHMNFKDKTLLAKK